jgi:hypothetical protein
MIDSNSDCTENMSDLIALQVRFAFSYVEEARSAYARGRSEYGNLARQIASNAHSAASRLAASMPSVHAPELAEVARLKRELDALTYEPVAVRSIA